MLTSMETKQLSKCLLLETHYTFNLFILKEFLKQTKLHTNILYSTTPLQNPWIKVKII